MSMPLVCNVSPTLILLCIITGDRCTLQVHLGVTQVRMLISTPTRLIMALLTPPLGWECLRLMESLVNDE
jgi:hypothetical protein